MKYTSRMILLSLFWTANLYCQQIEISGTASQFSGEEIYLRQVSNPIIGSSFILDTIRVDQRGEFRTRIQMETPGWIFMNTGLFRINMFLEPGTGYAVELPPKTEKSEADIRNPFYQPVLVHMKVLEEYPLDQRNIPVTGIDFNSRLYSFDTLVNNRNLELKDRVRMKKNVNTDSLITVIEDHYTEDSSSYFRTYRYLRYGLLKINSRDVGLQHIYEKYIGPNALQPDNPAFMDLFGEMYKEFLFYFSRTTDGSHIGRIINRIHDVDMLIDTLLLHAAVPDRTFAEFLVIKEVYDNYNRGYFFKEALLMLLDSIISGPEMPAHGRYAQEVKNNLTRLTPGNTPPEFSLKNSNDQFVSLEDLTGKYVYLNFCTGDNYSCLKEFPFLAALHRVHKDYFNIVTILVATDKFEMQRFMEKNNYAWTFLFYGNDNTLLSDYDVKAYPTSYLLDREGIIVQSPAVLPSEGLESQLFRIMRARGDL